MSNWWDKFRPAAVAEPPAAMKAASTSCPHCRLAVPLTADFCRVCGWTKEPDAIETEPEISYVCGLDLGKLQDFTALVTAKATTGPDGLALDLISLHRFELGTPYVTIARAVGHWLSEPPWDTAPLAIDKTGVGSAVEEIFWEAGVPNITPITITGGLKSSRVGGGWHVSKSELVSCVDALLGRRMLTIPEDLELRDTLVDELLKFEDRHSPVTADPIGMAYRQRPHDDCVLAVALAGWLAENEPRAADFDIRAWDEHGNRVDVGGSRDFTSLGSNRTDPTRRRSRVRYPQIRWFSQHGAYQAMPLIRGVPVLSCPTYNSQEEAASFVMEMHAQLGLPLPEFDMTAHLVPEVERLEAIARDVAKVIADRGLQREEPC